MYDFPSAPAVGAEYTVGAVTFVWNGYGWTVKGGDGTPLPPVDAYTKTESDANFVNIPGDTMTGGLTAPTFNLNAGNLAISDGVNYLLRTDGEFIVQGTAGAAKLNVSAAGLVSAPNQWPVSAKDLVSLDYLQSLGYVLKTGDTMTGPLTINTAGATKISLAGGNTNSIYAYNGNPADPTALRWIMDLHDPFGNFALTRFGPTGVAIGTNLSLNAQNGDMTVAGNIEVKSPVGNSYLYLHGTDTGVFSFDPVTAASRWRIFLNFTEFNLARYDDAGNLYGGTFPIRILRTDGIPMLNGAKILPQGTGLVGSPISFVDLTMVVRSHITYSEASNQLYFGVGGRDCAVSSDGSFALPTGLGSFSFRNSAGQQVGRIEWTEAFPGMRFYAGGWQMILDPTNGGLTVPGSIFLNGGNSSGVSFNTAAGGLMGKIEYLEAFPALRFYVNGGAQQTYWDPPSNIWTFPGDCAKPGGGQFANSSDARIKTVAGDYTQGLAAIQQLNPVRYSFKSNFVEKGAVISEEDPMASAASRDTAKEYIGLVAQEAEIAMPELVSLSEGYIDGAAVADLRRLDPSALTYALVNAVKEMAARIEALEAQLPAARK